MHVTFYLKARRNLRISQENEDNARTRTTTHFFFVKTEEVTGYQPQIGWSKRLINDETKVGKITKVTVSSDGKSLEVYLKARGISELDFEFLESNDWKKTNPPKRRE